MPIPSDKDFKKFENQFPSIVIRREADLYEEHSKPPEVLEIILKGVSIVAIKACNGTTKLVIFRPTVSTRRAAKIFENVRLNLSIEDANGLFSSQRPQTIIGSIYQSGNDTMIITTENQE